MNTCTHLVNQCTELKRGLKGFHHQLGLLSISALLLANTGKLFIK